jgi:hypothetical protein
MDIFSEGLKILITTVLSVYGLRGFKVFQKLFSFHYPMQLLTFYLLLRNYLLILKMLTETLLNIPSALVGLCSLMPTLSLAAEEMCKN